MLGALRFFPSLLVASETVTSDELVKEETSDQLYFQKGASCCSLGIGGGIRAEDQTWGFAHDR